MFADMPLSSKVLQLDPFGQAPKASLLVSDCRPDPHRSSHHVRTARQTSYHTSETNMLQERTCEILSDIYFEFLAD